MHNSPLPIVTYNRREISDYAVGIGHRELGMGHRELGMGHRELICLLPKD
ncbi:MAG: hypothetical protein WBL95_22065 [Microcoleus sp.]